MAVFISSTLISFLHLPSRMFFFLSIADKTTCSKFQDGAMLFCQANVKLTSASTGPRRDRRSIRRLVERWVRQIRLSLVSKTFSYYQNIQVNVQQLVLLCFLCWGLDYQRFNLFQIDGLFCLPKIVVVLHCQPTLWTSAKCF